MPPFIDLTNQKFGRLTVVRRAKNAKNGHALWNCRCDCGNISIVDGVDLRAGNSQSCGCLQKEITRIIKTTHNMARTSEYKTWATMIQRCYNPNNPEFKRYGGRGIKICAEWKNDFMAFYNHIGPKPSKKHSIDRINNEGNYEPGNTKWSLPQEQANNRRSNHKISINGWSLNISQWAKFAGLHQKTLSDRINKLGWPPEKAILKPIEYHKPNAKTLSSE